MNKKDYLILINKLHTLQNLFRDSAIAYDNLITERDNLIKHNQRLEATMATLRAQIAPVPVQAVTSKKATKRKPYV